jgi:hypothetical protein
MFAADIRLKSKFAFMLGRLPNASTELLVFLQPANKWRSHNRHKNFTLFFTSFGPGDQ